MTKIKVATIRPEHTHVLMFRGTIIDSGNLDNLADYAKLLDAKIAPAPPRYVPRPPVSDDLLDAQIDSGDWHGDSGTCARCGEDYGDPHAIGCEYCGPRTMRDINHDDIPF